MTFFFYTMHRCMSPVGAVDRSRCALVALLPSHFGTRLGSRHPIPLENERTARRRLQTVQGRMAKTVAGNA